MAKKLTRKDKAQLTSQNICWKCREPLIKKGKNKHCTKCDNIIVIY